MTYKQQEDVRLIYGMLDSLTFLPLDEVQAGMDHLRMIMPRYDKVQALVDDFDATYMSGTVLKIQRPGQALKIHLRRNPPMFPPCKWNVHETTLNSDNRINNICEDCEEQRLQVACVIVFCPLFRYMFRILYVVCIALYVFMQFQSYRWSQPPINPDGIWFNSMEQAMASKAIKIFLKLNSIHDSSAKRRSYDRV